MGPHLALAEGGARGRAQGHGPERGDVQHRNEAEVVSPARQGGEDRLSNLQDARALSVERNEQED